MNDYLKFLEQVVPAVVSIRSVTPQRHPSARILGTERTGSGSVIDAEGHILALRIEGYGNLGAYQSNATAQPPKPAPVMRAPITPGATPPAPRISATASSGPTASLAT